MPLPPNLGILVSQVTMEMGLSQDSDGNFCQNLDQNPHGRAQGWGGGQRRGCWKPPASVPCWCSCKSMPLLPHRTFPRATHPPNCKSPNPSLLMKVMYPDVPQWSMAYPCKNHWVRFSKSNFLQARDLLFFVCPKPRISRFCGEPFRFHLPPATKV